MNKSRNYDKVQSTDTEIGVVGVNTLNEKPHSNHYYMDTDGEEEREKLSPSLNILEEAQNKRMQLVNYNTYAGCFVYYTTVLFYYCVHILSPVLQMFIVAESVAITQFSIMLKTKGDTLEALRVSVGVGITVSVFLCFFSIIRIRMESIRDDKYTGVSLLLLVVGDVSVYSFIEFMLYVIVLIILSVSLVMVQTPCEKDDYICIAFMQYLKEFSGE